MAVTPTAVAFGLIGAGQHEERFDAKQVLVWPDSADGVRIREVVDQDFGNHDRHGYQRIIPTDFGSPTDIVAESPDAPDDVDMIDYGYEVWVRIGDPDTTIDGQHRYVLSYTLPEAHLSSGYLLLDIIGHAETFETGRFEVLLAGFELSDTACHSGQYGTTDGCTLTREGDLYRVVFEPLPPGQGITIEGTIVSMQTGEPGIAIPPIHDRRDDRSLALALVCLAIGTVMGVGTFLLARRLGRNEVAGGGAAEAAYAGVGGAGALAGASTRMISDRELAGLATTEFVPPDGMYPWQGALLLREKVDAQTVGAWFSEQIARERLLIDTDDDKVLRRGPRLSEAPATDLRRIERLLGGDDEIRLGKYQPAMATLWTQLTKEQVKAASKSGWWLRSPAGGPVRYPFALGVGVGLLSAVLAFAMWRGWWDSELLALGLAIALPTVVAGTVYRDLLPGRSALGSALALRVESFRNFLSASEGRHVEWAWSKGLLREYSAWAVALGAADAWKDAVEASGIPQPEIRASTTPLLVHTYAHSFATAHTAPSKSGSSGGGGGFSSGGFSGGGGGGGSSGSW